MARKDLQKVKNKMVGLRETSKPNAEWKYNFRQALLIKVKTQTMARLYEQKLADDLGFFGFVKNLRQRPALMPASVFAIVLLAFFGVSFGTVIAAKGSLPGDALFPVKLAVERTQLSTKKDQEEKTRFMVEITNRRLEELIKVAEAETSEDGQEEKSQKIEQAVSELEQQIKNIQNDLPRIEKEPQGVLAAKEITEKIAIVENALVEVGKGVKEKDLAEKINSTAKLADATTTEALTVVAQRADSEQISKEEILNKVEEKIAKTEETIKLVDEKIDEISVKEPEISSGISASLAREQSEKAREILDKAKEILGSEEDLVLVLKTVKTAKEIVSGAEELLIEVEEEVSVAQQGKQQQEESVASESAESFPAEPVSEENVPEESQNTETDQPETVLPVLEDQYAGSSNLQLSTE